MNGSYRKSRIERITRCFGLTPLKYKWLPSVYRKQAVIRIKTSGGYYALKPYVRSPLFKTSTIQQMSKTWSDRLKAAQWLDEWARLIK
ncbi:spore coat protein I [Paenibacillus macerans]|uniref:Uncharacterized protein n=1 Tax=Paenibacillus macerans TaxID=44252 RepID=A0A090Y842_PAEMA|nr:hypothetical protein DJ90_1277 [Paenibacillus macerans]SUD25327.1 spore coat protein I [Paenibacillus macerans]